MPTDVNVVTVDKKRKISCEWCANMTDNYNCVSDKHGTYCSGGCRDEARSNRQAACNHLTAVDINEIDGRTYGMCEECEAEIEKVEGEWVRA